MTPYLFFNNDKKALRGVPRFAQFSTAAITEAAADSDIFAVCPKDEIALIVGTGVGGSSYFGEMQLAYDRRVAAGEPGDSGLRPSSLDQILNEKGATIPGILFGITGETEAVIAACAGGNANIIFGTRILKLGEMKAAIAGAAEAAIDKFSLGTFSNAHALSTNNADYQNALKPFDEDRDGFVIGEGAGILVLERLEDALARKARIHAEIVGYAIRNDAFDAIEPDPNGDGARRAMIAALKMAQLEPWQIDYVNAHGTATVKGDWAEKIALWDVFGPYEKRPLVSSTKSMMGHLFGAAGAVEAVISVKAIQDSLAPATTTLVHEIDDRIDFVKGVARPATINHVLSLSIGVGGINSVIIFKRYVPD